MTAGMWFLITLVPLSWNLFSKKRGDYAFTLYYFKLYYFNDLYILIAMPATQVVTQLKFMLKLSLKCVPNVKNLMLTFTFSHSCSSLVSSFSPAPVTVWDYLATFWGQVGIFATHSDWPVDGWVFAYSTLLHFKDPSSLIWLTFGVGAAHQCIARQ